MQMPEVGRYGRGYPKDSTAHSRHDLDDITHHVFPAIACNSSLCYTFYARELARAGYSLARWQILGVRLSPVASETSVMLRTRPGLPIPLYIGRSSLSRTGRTPHEVKRTLEALLRTYDLEGGNSPGLSRKLAIGGGVIGVLLGYSPMGILFGPIGAGIGAILASLFGLGAGEAIERFLNRPKAALAAVETGDFDRAILLYRECLRDLGDGPVADIFKYHLHKLVENPQNVSGDLLKAAYYAACAFLEQVQGMRSASLTDYGASIKLYPSNQAILEQYIGLLDPGVSTEREAALSALRYVLAHLEETAPEPGVPDRHWDEAITGLYELWAQTFPEDSSNLRRLANCYAQLGETNDGLKRALEVLRVIAWLEPQDPQVREAIRRVEERLDLLGIKDELRGIRSDLRAFADRLYASVEELRAGWPGRMEVPIGSFLGPSAGSLGLDEAILSEFADRVHRLVHEQIERERLSPDVRDMQEQLAREFEAFSYLSLESQDFLAIAEFLWAIFKDTPLPDCSPASVEYAKSLEAELRALIQGFVEHLERAGQLETFLQPYLDGSAWGPLTPQENYHARRNYRLLAEAIHALAPITRAPSTHNSRYRLTIVQIGRILEFPQSKGGISSLMNRFKAYIDGLPGASLYRDPAFYKGFLVDSVGHRYRNGAAHTERLDRDTVARFRGELLNDPGYLWAVARGKRATPGECALKGGKK